MFVFSIKLSKAVKVVAGTALVLALGAGLALGVSKVVKNNNAMAVNTKVSLDGKSEEDRMKYIESYGVQVNGEPHQVVEVMIPQEFEGPYQAYNDLQKKQGFDLTKQKGKLCKQWTYMVEKPSSKDGKCVVNILVLEGKIIGADITNLSTGAQQTLEEFGGKQSNADTEEETKDTQSKTETEKDEDAKSKPETQDSTTEQSTEKKPATDSVSEDFE